VPSPVAGIPLEYRRAASLYTWGLTPAFEILEQGLSIDSLFEESGGVPREMVEGHPRFFARNSTEREELFNFSAELDYFHADFDLIADEMEIPEDMDDVYSKRLVVNYHAENFDYRLFSYREKTYRLINITLRLGVQEGMNNSGSGDFNDYVMRALERRRFQSVAAIQNCWKFEPFSSAVKRRNALVHRLAKRDPLLSSRRRAEEVIRELDEVEQVGHLVNLEVWRRAKRKELDKMCEQLADFRYRLVVALTEALARLR
jgi:hypothetical protein